MFITKLSKCPPTPPPFTLLIFIVMGQSMAAGPDVGFSSVTTSLPITTLTPSFPGGSLHTCLPLAELYAILDRRSIFVYFFVNSQAALYALQSTSLKNCGDVI
ncbi:hypothetical protein E2C01_004969 [Portunus trituberculatus]|uniref:Uncharacterized protein n=1 Tax=Portunus trituberculatus TaxID=210409 RepID=A0A5B7CVC5_PORTR|nr:hypothetical protein [Portunus trituberculatus]